MGKNPYGSGILSGFKKTKVCKKKKKKKKKAAKKGLWEKQSAHMAFTWPLWGFILKIFKMV